MSYSSYQRVRNTPFRVVVLLLGIITLVFSCQKEFSLNPSLSPLIPEIDRNTTVANIQGYVFDENNQPVQGASVKVANKSVLTNAYGTFFITDVTTSVHNTVITISKTGYFNNIKTTIVSTGEDHFIKAQLMRKVLVKTFDASSGSKVTLTNGSAVLIQPNSIRLADGVTPYTGKVNVYMAWLNPAEYAVLYQMPGELRGIAEDGSERSMQTFGMLNVQLESEDNQKLQLDNSKPATLNFPIPASLSANAPANVPMWYYNEITGRWVEEGMAQRNGSTYQTLVKHFTYWNVDWKYEEPLIQYCVVVVDENDKPYANSHILIHRANDSWGAHGYTNSNGYVCGLIPEGIPLKLDILGEVTCEQAILSTPIGPFRGNVALDTVVVRRNPEKTLTVSGKAVDCNNKPVTKGYVQATVRSQGYVGKVTNGEFEFTIIRCPGDKELTSFGVDEVNNRISDQKTKKFTGNKVDLGTIIICGSPENTINNALMAHYPLDGDAKDVSPNKLDGQIIGTPTAVKDHLGNDGKAMHFDGVDSNSALQQYINIPNSANKNPLPFSVSLWVKADTTNSSTDGNVFNKYVPGLWNGFQIIFGKDMQTKKYYLIPWYLNSGANRVIGDYGEPPFNTEVPGDKWNHFVFTVDEIEGIMYLNNVKVGTHPWTGTAKPSTNGLNWKIGGKFVNWFKGSIDELRVYNRALKDFEVQYLYEH